MADYKRILVALDFSPVARSVIECAKEMGTRFGAQLYLLHVVEYLPPMEPAGDMFIGVDWGINEQDLVDAANKQLEQMARTAGLADCEREVLLGNARVEIAQQAKDGQCDLIVIGSHGRRGLSRLLGSTADAVLHRAECDVLAVRAR
jgi:universal stress protein A